MLKNIVAPIQAWLLYSGKCVGCGKPLDKYKKIALKGKTEKVICKCGRVYIFDKETKKYRRALIKEV